MKAKLVKESIYDDNDLLFFKNLIGETIKCKIEYINRKNSLTSTFADKGDIFIVEDLNVYIEEESHIIHKNVSDISTLDTISSISLIVKNNTDIDKDVIPDINTIKKFKLYFDVL